jgi:hypothetical protein
MYLSVPGAARLNCITPKELCEGSHRRLWLKTLVHVGFGPLWKLFSLMLCIRLVFLKRKNELTTAVEELNPSVSLLYKEFLRLA